MNKNVDFESPMRITENEAQNRLCPFQVTEQGTCVGSQCMGWRWVGKYETYKESEGFCGMCPQFPSR